MRNLGKNLKNKQDSVAKNLGKTIGISASKMTSILFLLITIVIALALSGVAWLITRKPATLPLLSEGMEDKKETATPDAVKEEPKDAKKEEVKESKENTEENNGDMANESFRVKQGMKTMKEGGPVVNPKGCENPKNTYKIMNKMKVVQCVADCKDAKTGDFCHKS